MKKLTNGELLNLQGGVSREEYCATLKMLIGANFDTDNWDDDQRNAATDAWRSVVINIL